MTKSAGNFCSHLLKKSLMENFIFLWSDSYSCFKILGKYRNFILLINYSQNVHSLSFKGTDQYIWQFTKKGNRNYLNKRYCKFLYCNNKNYFSCQFKCQVAILSNFLSKQKSIHIKTLMIFLNKKNAFSTHDWALNLNYSIKNLLFTHKQPQPIRVWL